MDLMPYKNQLNRLRQSIINVELAQTAYMDAIEMVSHGMHGAGERVKEAEQNLQAAEQTLKNQSKINEILNQE